MAHPANLMKELEHIEGWVTAQKAAGVDAQLIADSQAEVIRSKVRLLKPLEYDDATQLLDRVTHIGPICGWSSKQKMDIVVEINSKLQTHSSRAGGATVRRANQDCTSFHLYLDADENTALRDPRTSDRAMVSILKKRALLIGLHCASEASKADVANIIRHLGRKGEMHPAAWEKLLGMVRTGFADLKKNPWKMEWVTKYPDDPDNLPETIYKHAYKQNPPAKQELEGIEDVEFVRKNNAKWSATTGQTFYPGQLADLAHMNNLFNVSGRMAFSGTRERSPRRTRERSPENPGWAMRYQPERLAIQDLPGHHGQPATEQSPAPSATKSSSALSAATEASAANIQKATHELTLQELDAEDAALRKAMAKPDRRKTGKQAAKEDDEEDSEEPAPKRKPAAADDADEEEGTEEPAPKRKPAAAPAKPPPKAVRAPARKTPSANTDKPATTPKAPHADDTRATHSLPTPGHAESYRGARVYYSVARKGFRVVVNPASNPSDEMFSFKVHGGSTKRAWSAVVQRVDSERDGEEYIQAD